jgi:hypothetical protein
MPPSKAAYAATALLRKHVKKLLGVGSYGCSCKATEQGATAAARNIFRTLSDADKAQLALGEVPESIGLDVCRHAFGYVEKPETPTKQKHVTSRAADLFMKEQRLAIKAQVDAVAEVGARPLVAPARQALTKRVGWNMWKKDQQK